jgi:hypothetical protein
VADFEIGAGNLPSFHWKPSPPPSQAARMLLCHLQYLSNRSGPLEDRSFRVAGGKSEDFSTEWLAYRFT